MILALLQDGKQGLLKESSNFCNLGCSKAAEPVGIRAGLQGMRRTPYGGESMNLKTTALVSGTLLASLSLSTNAALITGDVGFGGEYSPLASEGGAEVDLGEAGYIDITDNEAVVTTGGTGDLSGLTAFGTVVDYNGFTIGEAPADPLWSGGGFEFELTGMNVVEQTDTVLGLSGEGIMSAEDFEDTPYLWSFSADAAGDAEFAFSSTNTEVPEPGTLSLLGLGLIGLGAARRRMKS